MIKKRSFIDQDEWALRSHMRAIEAMNKGYFAEEIVIHELRRTGGDYGIAAICSGAAQGDAILLHVDP